ncbi:MAG TPA: hypothetical protein VLK36_01600 [Gaiellaceae bacterium]|nr:hypothetical protein [Gaiellaceae bacterium]
MSQLPGIRWLRFGFAVAAVLSFVGCWVWFFWQIWTQDGHPVTLNDRLLYFSSAIGGVLGTFFAVEMGIRQDTGQDSSRIATLPTGAALVGRKWDSRVVVWFAVAAVYAYAAIGLFALVTWAFRSAQSPPAVEALASVFLGFFVAIAGAGLMPGVATPGPGSGPTQALEPPAAPPQH